MGNGFQKGTCSNCGQHVEYPLEAAGQSVACPGCGAAIQLPAPAAVPLNQPRQTVLAKVRLAASIAVLALGLVGLGRALFAADLLVGVVGLGLVIIGGDNLRRIITRREGNDSSRVIFAAKIWDLSPPVLLSFGCAALLGIGAVILPVWLLSLRPYTAPLFPLIRTGIEGMSYLTFIFLFVRETLI